MFSNGARCDSSLHSNQLTDPLSLARKKIYTNTKFLRDFCVKFESLVCIEHLGKFAMSTRSFLVHFFDGESGVLEIGIFAFFSLSEKAAFFCSLNKVLSCCGRTLKRCLYLIDVQ